MLRRRSLSDIHTLKGRNADLLACFPPRARSLMPKPICSSPARAAEPPSRHHHKKRGGGGSPHLWATDILSEPTSPKVTCAGQIKVRPKPSPCKNWHSVIERIHNNRKLKKRSPWIIETLGFKKDVKQFLTCLRNIRFDFRCFGSFPTTEISSEDEEDGYEANIRNLRLSEENDNDNSKAVFSKLFMLLREEDQGKEEMTSVDNDVPPENALLLMRCRSAPAKSWLEEREVEERERKQRLVVMACGEEFPKLSADIAKETWVGEGIREFLASPSWRR